MDVVKPVKVDAVKPVKVDAVKPVKVDAVKPVKVDAVKPVKVDAVVIFGSLAAPDPTTLKKKGLGKLNTTKRGATGM